MGCALLGAARAGKDAAPVTASPGTASPVTADRAAVATAARRAVARLGLRLDPRRFVTTFCSIPSSICSIPSSMCSGNSTAPIQLSGLYSAARNCAAAGKTAEYRLWSRRVCHSFV